MQGRLTKLTGAPRHLSYHNNQGRLDTGTALYIGTTGGSYGGDIIIADHMLTGCLQLSNFDGCLVLKQLNPRPGGGLSRLRRGGGGGVKMTTPSN